MCGHQDVHLIERLCQSYPDYIQIKELLNDARAAEEVYAYYRYNHVFGYSHFFHIQFELLYVLYSQSIILTH